MLELLHRLNPREQRGSKPRCHFLTHRSAKTVAENLSRLAAPFGQVSPSDRWMPQGFDNVIEAQLHRATTLLSVSNGQALKAWWLAVPTMKSVTPNIDIASTCTIGKRFGLLLIEAKAHDQELIKEETGKALKPPVTVSSRRNHLRIGTCIQDANLGLSDATGLPWALSRDWNCQMSNRFAWAWKLTELGIPVILIYLGFLHADEMADKGKPLTTHHEWEQLVRSHSAPIVPSAVWESEWEVNGHPFVPLIRSYEFPLE